MTRESLLAAAVLGLGAAACSPGRNCPGDASTPAPIEPAPRNALCNGSDERRLLAQFGGSGLSVPGSAVLAENGYDFLVVDGRCHFWVQRESFGDVREGFLDEAQANEILVNLRLSSWPSLAGRYQSALCDGPWHHYRYEDAEIAIVPVCTGRPGDAAVAWIRPALRELIVRLHSTGIQVRGGVRFTLVANDEAEYPRSSDAFRNAPPWPLSSAPALLALSLAAAGSQGPGGSHAAAPPESQCLQQVAASYREGEIGDRYSGFAPVLDHGGRSFRLFVRDSVPFEDESGLWTLAP